MEKKEPTEPRIREDIGHTRRPTRDSYDKDGHDNGQRRPLNERKEKVNR